MLYRFFRLVGSLFAYIFEELLDNDNVKSKPRLEPATGTIRDLNEEKELPPIQLD
ncbi:hypothetical protein [Kaarinaea lacus]